MAWMVRGYVDICWVPEGTGGVTIMATGGEANEPGYGSALAAGAMPTAQTLRLQQAEAITGTNAAPPNVTAIQAGITQMATDLNSQITAAIVTQIDNWATGGP